MEVRRAARDADRRERRGKTTTMKAITGLKAYSAGDIEYEGKSIKGIPTHELLKRGLAMVPEGRGSSRGCRSSRMQMGAYLRNDGEQIRRTSTACSASSRA